MKIIENHKAFLMPRLNGNCKIDLCIHFHDHIDKKELVLYDFSILYYNDCRISSDTIK